MTVHAWVEFDEKKINFPNICGSFICWPVEVEEWCRAREISVHHKDWLWAFAFLSKGQILTFIDDAYAPIFARAKERGLKSKDEPVIAQFRSEIEHALQDDRLYKLSGLDY